MKQVSLSELEGQQAFVKRAAVYFAKNPEKDSYTDGEIKSGCLFAMRWGLNDDCVLLFQLSEDVEPLIFKQAILAAVQ